MAAETKIKALAYLQQVRPTNRKWQLTKRMTATDTTAYVNFEPTNQAGAAITDPFEITIGVERMLVTSYIGTVLTVTRGMARGGLDFAGAAGNAEPHDTGDEVVPSVSPLMLEMYYRCFDGTIATGGQLFKVGDGTDADIFLYAYNADANKPYLKYDKATNAWVLSNDGVAEVALATGGVSTASVGIQIVAADIRLDLTDTTAFVVTTAGAADAGKVAVLNASGLINQDNVEVWKDVLATSAEINVLAGFLGNTANLNLVTTGGDVPATTHTHSHLVIVNNVGSGTRAHASGAGTTVVAHGLGKTPTSIEFSAASVSATGVISMGFVDSALGNKCTSTTGTTSQSGTTSSAINVGGVSTNYVRGIVTAWDATSFTITWTTNGTGTGDASFSWKASSQ